MHNFNKKLIIFIKIHNRYNMRPVYLPPEIWIMIYEYDSTYKIVYNNCMQEMMSYFNHNRINCIMNTRFYHYNTLYLNHSNDKTKMSCSKYIKLTNLRDTHYSPYKNLNSVVHNKDCWQHFIKSSKGKIYTKM